jgi:hypothetical protein
MRILVVSTFRSVKAGLAICLKKISQNLGNPYVFCSSVFTVIGYPSDDGSSGPSDTRTYIMTSESVPQQARLVNFKLFAKNTSPVYLQIWRKTNQKVASDNTYTVVHTQQYVPTQTGQELVVSNAFIHAAECSIESILINVKKSLTGFSAAI